MKDIFLAIMASGGVFSLVQFFITFGFSRKDKSKEIEQKLDLLSDKIDESQAINARTAILRFSDELKYGMKHSKEYYKQILDDCDIYENFCKAHPGFRNSYTEIADKHIKETYENLMREGKL